MNQKDSMLYRQPEAGKELLLEGFDAQRLREIYNERMPIEQPALLQPEQLGLNPMEIWVSERINPGKMLDIGCGNGKFLLHLAFYGKITSGLGIDVSDAMITNAEKGRVKHGLKNISFERLAFENWNKNDTYDIISMNDTMEHLYSPWWCVRLVVALLGHNGLFIGMVPYEYDCDADVHLHHFTSDNMQRFLEGFFDDVQIKEFHWENSDGSKEGKIAWRCVATTLPHMEP